MLWQLVPLTLPQKTINRHERIIKILADNTGKDIDQIRQDIQQKDKWFNSVEALEYGLVDKLLTKNAL